MKNKSESLLPKIMPGTVQKQLKRCGKANCKCRTRDELHISFYHFYRINGRLVKRYLRRDKVAEMRAACLARQKMEKHFRQRIKGTLQTLREMREELRQVHRQYNFAEIFRNEITF